MKKIVVTLALAAFMYACNTKTDTAKTENQDTVEQPKSTERIVSLNGTITEILVDLGQQSNLVGVDVTSTYPADLGSAVTHLDHVNKINFEALLELKPTVVYVAKKDLNDDLNSKLQRAGIKVIALEQDFSVEGTKKLISEVASSLDITDTKELFAKIDSEAATIKPMETKPKVLFIYARGAANLFVAGEDTPMQKIIALAGGVNAVEGFKDFKPLTPEALLNSNPDYILLFDTGLASMGGIDGVLNIDGINQTTAGKKKQIIAMEGLLLTGFTPRIGQAIQELNSKIAQ